MAIIYYEDKDIFLTKVYALVNPVNTVGIMGKGLALQFKERYPDNYESYRESAVKGEIKIGEMFVTKHNSTYIINFPTKKHYKNPSKIEYIKEGLIDLVRVIEKHKIKSIAIPALGCGLGGLNWSLVEPLIVAHLIEIEDLDVYLYPPK